MTEAFEPRRVPADTTEITYTGRGGAQISIAIEKRGGYAFATPASAADQVALDRLGFTQVARKAQKAEDTQPPAGGNETPATGGKES